MEFIKEIKSTLFIIAGFYIIVGLIMLLAPVFVTNSICYFIGTLCLILGGLAIYTYISSQVYGPLAYGILVIAIIFIVLGVFIVSNPKAFASFIPMIMGIILAVDAFTKMQSAASLKRYNYDKWWTVLVAAFIIFALAILLIFNPFGTLTIFIRVLGAFLILDGISNVLTAVSYAKIEKSIN